MTIKNRTVEEQHRLNGYRRRRRVLEYALYHSVQAEPATAGEVKQFLKTAPPEVFILLDGLAIGGPRGQRPHGVDKERNDRIVAGVVGWLLGKPGVTGRDH
ncbi:hypothetical protein [Spelaeicoccus albus]|uniref:Uncharacterized protein n=1 Tax=Spelaeicoccus albus TaxID=1280376 RepID=A0A7Z0A9H7_9MICO|nr:hypothetical protein [Spelaeicoccus albus]NYI66076.1 hypothetical protein [Spelaeicoccus albus]